MHVSPNMLVIGCNMHVTCVLFHIGLSLPELVRRNFQGLILK